MCAGISFSIKAKESEPQTVAKKSSLLTDTDDEEEGSVGDQQLQPPQGDEGSQSNGVGGVGAVAQAEPTAPPAVPVPTPFMDKYLRKHGKSTTPRIA